MRVVIAGDTSASAAALADRLSEHGGIEVVGLAGNAYETLDLVQTLVPHAVLLGLARAMTPDAIAAIRELGARVIVLSNGGEPANADATVASGGDLAEAFFDAASLALALGPRH